MKASWLSNLFRFSIVAVLTTPLLAGEATIEAVSESQGERAELQLEYRDDGSVRMNVPQQPGSYLLVKDQVAYSVSTQDGQAMVMRLDMLRGMGQMMPAPSPTGDLAEVGELERTGRMETVAGVTGEVWSLSYIDDDGSARQSEVVLSDDPRAVALTEAMNSLSSAMANALGQDADSASAVPSRFSGKGILRMGETMRVTSLSDSQPPLARFSLPAAPTEMPGGGGLGDRIGELFGQKAERQQNNVGERVEQEADNSLDKKVKGFLDSVF